MIVHGVNLSLSTPHDVANYACGRTPSAKSANVWWEPACGCRCAGNDGYLQYLTTKGRARWLHNISITDPAMRKA